MSVNHPDEMPKDNYISTFPVGLSKRELFSALAMQGICSGPNFRAQINERFTSVSAMAHLSVMLADALIEELEK